MIPWYLKALAGIGLLAGIFGYGWCIGHHGATLKANAQIAAIHQADAQALARAEQSARAQEQASAAKIAAITKTYEQEKTDAKAKSDRVVAELRAGTLRLRKEWQCPPRASVPATAGSVVGADEDADVRAADAANLVRIAAEADAQIKGLQAVIRSEREHEPNAKE